MEKEVKGLKKMKDEGKIKRKDVMIVERGGGSMEDIWGFKDEIVVREVED